MNEEDETFRRLQRTPFEEFSDEMLMKMMYAPSCEMERIVTEYAAKNNWLVSDLRIKFREYLLYGEPGQ